MGFEVIFHYYERNEEGPGYDTSEIKQLKKRIGDATEDVPYEKVAATIMSQMARRDIMVNDAEIFEFTKKKLTFRETKGGIVLGNKKYSYDSNEITQIVSEELAVPVSVAAKQSSPMPIEDWSDDERPVLPAKPIKIAPPVRNVSLDSQQNQGDLLYFQTRKPLRREILAPRDELALQTAKSFAVTVGKAYDIYEERPASSDPRSGMKYTIKDDKGFRLVLPDKLFDMIPTFEEDLDVENFLKLRTSGGGGSSEGIPALRR